mmetsp:Transcript_23719/g.55305  ORF Transcript_23719/g.55305 Transcript_23719/m.55305 type:complete len:86 (-) Transcript_23719:38-295(-)
MGNVVKEATTLGLFSARFTAVTTASDIEFLSRSAGWLRGFGLEPRNSNDTAAKATSAPAQNQTTDANCRMRPADCLNLKQPPSIL